MKIGILGGGSVGQTIGAALASKGHDVVLGIRSVNDGELDRERSMAKPLRQWRTETGAKVATLAEAARHGEIVINGTQGHGSLDALAKAGADALAGKILIDIANPLDFSRGFPPALMAEYATHTSLGEAIQAAFPQTKVVKALNTIAAAVMVDASKVPGDHDLFVSGNDAEAKEKVIALARENFGWKSFVDLGDIAGARATEHLLPIWLRLYATTGSPIVNLKVVR